MASTYWFERTCNSDFFKYCIKIPNQETILKKDKITSQL